MPAIINTVTLARRQCSKQKPLSTPHASVVVTNGWCVYHTSALYKNTVISRRRRRLLDLNSPTTLDVSLLSAVPYPQSAASDISNLYNNSKFHVYWSYLLWVTYKVCRCEQTLNTEKKCIFIVWVETQHQESANNALFTTPVEQNLRHLLLVIITAIVIIVLTVRITTTNKITVLCY